jgi:hypothetical protein
MIALMGKKDAMKRRHHTPEQIVANQSLDIDMLKEVNQGNF